MGPLTIELVRQICSYMGEHDVTNFRLVCKAYSNVGAEYIRPANLFMFMTNNYFEKLVTLSSSNQLARGLTSLEYAPITLYPLIYDETDYERFTIGAYDDDDFRPPPGGYHRYSTLLDEQDSIMKEDKDYQLFLSALPRFPRLRDFTLYCGDIWTVIDMKGIMDECNEFRYSTDLINLDAGSRHFGALLRALSDAKVHLETLTVVHIGWQFFDQDTQLHTIFQPIANLKSLDLTIDPRSDYDRNTNCREFMRTGPLRKCLPTITKLHSLNISFDSVDSTNYNPEAEDGQRLRYAPLDQVLPSGFTWTHLTSLSLYNIDSERQELLGFLLQHKETLRELSLQNIYLRSTSWIPLLDAMRRELFLTRPHFYCALVGHFEGGSEDGELQYWPMIYFDFPPFGVAEEDWVPKEDLCKLTERYILEGGRAYPEMKTCPLTSDNCGRR
ncbi:hypothetical protein F4820DRAFT_74657 [Hypoxylon rubiginosum]|uniref:Uncharacterized protein n=1 Tax=Hypoxylon rubiginosum TaxID=110542 RepID=A0ACB9YPP0_9PEZI|nr:hypothetical protein F4820DRAFT_74657 [Hypoxylon rubiginosum]